MEIKHLSTSLLENYRFEDGPLPQESYVSKDLMKSATIENLISQNEDLMSRLKVALRRLATLEDLNQDLQAQNFQQKNQILNYSDQVQVLKEKDQAWKSKVDELEAEKERLSSDLADFDSTKVELERFKKYHDKIRLQVKPYIQSLKVARDEAVQQLEQVRRQIQMRDSQLQDVRHQMQEVLRQSKNQIDEVYRQKQDVVSHMEQEIQRLLEDRSHLEKGSIELQSRMQSMTKALEQKAELENRVIELERLRDDQKVRFENEILRLQARANELLAAQTRLEIENQDLKRHVQDDYEAKMKTEQEITQLRRQMESLRFMWNQKNDEVQRYQKSLEALERLNLSLSEKIEELRTQSLSSSLSSSSESP